MSEGHKLPNGPYQVWIKDRIRTLNFSIGAHRVLRDNGVALSGDGSVRESVVCPFHDDKSPSARYFPEDDQDPSGLWCWVCRKRWDAVAAFKTFRGYEGPFTSLVRTMEQEYHVDPGPVPEEIKFQAEQERQIANQKLDQEIQHLLEVCESRLIRSKKAFQLEGYVRVGTALDHLRTHWSHHHDPAYLRNGVEVLLAKITEKATVCLEI